MPRRASSGPKPAVMFGGGLLLILLCYFGFQAMGGSTDKGFEGVATLDVSDFQENGNSLRGNEYVIEGTVDEKLRWNGDRGQVLSVYVEQGGSSGFIPVEVPASLKSGNIDIRQDYAFKVRFRDGGIAVASGISPL